MTMYSVVYEDEKIVVMYGDEVTFSNPDVIYHNYSPFLRNNKDETIPLYQYTVFVNWTNMQGRMCWRTVKINYDSPFVISKEYKFLKNILPSIEVCGPYLKFSENDSMLFLISSYELKTEIKVLNW